MIQEAQKQMDPTDPDPQHWLEGARIQCCGFGMIDFQIRIRLFQIIRDPFLKLAMCQKIINEMYYYLVGTKHCSKL